jgi:hypothetical protein
MMRRFIGCILLLCVIFLSACTRPATATGITPADADALKRAVMSAVNDDRWFNGVYSDFHTMEGHSYKINLYSNKESPDLSCVYFTQGVRDSDYELFYYALFFEKSPDGIRRTGMIKEKTAEAVQDRIAEYGYVYGTQSRLRVIAAKQPEYAALKTGDKEAVLDDIKAFVKESLKEDWGRTNEYTLYIRDFCETDRKTYVVAESLDGEGDYLFTVHFAGEWNIAPTTAGDLVPIDSERLKYNAAQYEKAAVRETTIDLTPIDEFYAVTRDGDAYTLALYDTHRNTLYTQTQSKEPIVTNLDSHILRFDTGIPTQATFFYDTLSGEVSPVYENPLLVDGDRIVYLRDSRTLVVSDLFYEEIYCKKIEREFSGDTAGLSEMFPEVRWIGEDELYIEYLTSNGKKICSEVIDLREVPSAYVEKTGNTMANIVNKGFLVKEDGWVYFTLETGLYRVREDGTQLTQLFDGTVLYLNIWDGWIYCAIELGGIYRISADGAARQKISGEKANYVYVKDGWIYYSTIGERFMLSYTAGYRTEYRINKIRLDGTGRVCVVSELAGKQDTAVSPSPLFYIDDGWIYYKNMSDQYRLYRVRINCVKKTKVSDELLANDFDSAGDFIVDGGWVYYTQPNDYYALYRMAADGSTTVRATKGRISRMAINDSGAERILPGWIGRFMITDDWIYYIDMSDNWKLYRVHKDGTGKELVSDVSIYALGMTGDTLYFQSYFDRSAIFQTSVDPAQGSEEE